MTQPFIPRRLSELELDWPTELDHLSANSIKMAARCPEQWRQRYCLGKIYPPSFSMLAGRADHAAIERSMRQKITSGVDLPVGEVKDDFLATFEKEIEESGGIGEIELTKSGQRITDRKVKQQEMDEHRWQGPKIVGLYHGKVSPSIQPISVEREFTLEVPGLPVKMIGYIDLEAVDRASADIQERASESESVVEPERADEVESTVEYERAGDDESTASRERAEVPESAVPRVRLIDRKRRGQNNRNPQPEWTVQAEVYQLVNPVPHEWHISVTTKDPQLLIPANGDDPLVQQVLPKERSELLLQQIVADIGACYKRYGPDNPWPARGVLHAWACNYCGFRDDCWAWKR